MYTLNTKNFKVFTLGLSFFLISHTMISQIQLYPRLSEYVKELPGIPEERKESLDELAAYITTSLKNKNEVDLIFICTHNSRRSHMSQIFAAAAADYYGLEGIRSYSGGTEVTAFNSRAVDAMRRAGFRIPDASGPNPDYNVSWSEDRPGITCFSKKYDDPENPGKEFAAIMTCSDADKNCPFIPGAEERISIPYVDPKEADGTSFEQSRYDERALQIASEMFYIMKKVAG